MDDASIKRRIAGRELAVEIATLIEGEIGNALADDRKELAAAFWAEMRRRFAVLQVPKALAVQAAEPLNDHQARTWGRTKMPFGIHCGKPIDEIPLEYLENIAEPKPFIRMLRRYLASRRIEAEQGDDLNHE